MRTKDNEMICFIHSQQPQISSGWWQQHQCPPTSISRRESKHKLLTPTMTHLFLQLCFISNLAVSHWLTDTCHTQQCDFCKSISSWNGDWFTHLLTVRYDSKPTHRFELSFLMFRSYPVIRFMAPVEQLKEWGYNRCTHHKTKSKHHINVMKYTHYIIIRLLVP